MNWNFSTYLPITFTSFGCYYLFQGKKLEFYVKHWELISRYSYQDCNHFKLSALKIVVWLDHIWFASGNNFLLPFRYYTPCKIMSLWHHAVALASYYMYSVNYRSNQSRTLNFLIKQYISILTVVSGKFYLFRLRAMLITSYEVAALA